MNRVPDGMPGPTEQAVRDLVTRIVDGVFERSPDSGLAPPPATEGVQSPAGGVAPGAAIAVGADHGGYAMKEKLAFRLREAGYEVIDFGTDGPDSVDYPDFAAAVATAVAGGEAAAGIVVDGAGIGSAMAANKVPGVRAALCYDLSSARNSREHNHANVLTLGAGLIGDGLAWQIVQEWLSVEWGGGRHARRVDKITDLERAHLRRPGGVT
jgi:ribose 5-phosphate isomerase B